MVTLYYIGSQSGWSKSSFFIGRDLLTMTCAVELNAICVEIIQCIPRMWLLAERAWPTLSSAMCENNKLVDVATQRHSSSVTIKYILSWQNLVMPTLTTKSSMMPDLCGKNTIVYYLCHSIGLRPYWASGNWWWPFLVESLFGIGSNELIVLADGANEIPVLPEGTIETAVSDSGTTDRMYLVMTLLSLHSCAVALLSRTRWLYCSDGSILLWHYGCSSPGWH